MILYKIANISGGRIEVNVAAEVVQSHNHALMV